MNGGNGGAGRGAGGGAGGGTGAGRRRLAWALEAIGEASEHFAVVIEHQGSDGLDAVVPTTPLWTLRDLAHHLGKVQRSWAENVRSGDPATPWRGEVALPADDGLVGWLRECTVSLGEALAAAGPGAPCWTWWGVPATAGAVARHQVQEAAVHTWDAEGSVGVSSPLATDVAQDGVPEFIEIMIGSDAEVLGGAVTLTATDTGGSWSVAGSHSGRRRRRESELRASASELVLMLYRRLPVPDASVEGDPMLVASLLSLADTS